MREKTATTGTSAFKYGLTYSEFESLAEVGGEDKVLAIVNAAQRQNALQGGKSVVLAAIKKAEERGVTGQEALNADEEVAKAVEAHQKSAAGYRIGTPRGGGTKSESGLTRKQEQQLGTKVGVAMARKGGKPLTAKEMADIYEEVVNGADEVEEGGDDE